MDEKGLYGLDEEVREVVDEILANFETDQYNEWADFREDALRFYNADPEILPSKKGKSRYVSMDTAEVIDGLTPIVIEPFLQCDPLTFRATSVSSQQHVKHMQRYVNYNFMTRNDGKKILETAVKDAGLLRIGVAKTYWKEEEETVVTTYGPLSDEDIAWLEDQDDVISINIDEDTGSTTVTRTQPKSYVAQATVAPENFIFDPNAECLDRARYVGEKAHYAEWELQAEFPHLDKETISAAVKYCKSDEQVIRDEPNTYSPTTEDGTVAVYQLYIRHDFDGDGKPELTFFQFLDDKDKTILAREVVNIQPYSILCLVTEPHKIIGGSWFDYTRMVQLLKTNLWRQTLDNIYNLNNGRPVISPNVDLRDLSNNEPGAKIRAQSPQTDIAYLTPPSILGNSMPMLEKIDLLRAELTGFHPTLAQMDPENMNLSGNALGQVIAQSQVKQRSYIRNIGEFLKDIAVKTLAVAQVNMPEGDYFELPTATGNVEAITPTDWDDQYDIVINVGLGTQDRLFEIQQIEKAGEVISELITLQGGPMGLFVNPNSIYTLAKKQLDRLLPNGSEAILVDPATYPPELQQALMQKMLGGGEQQQDPALQIAQYETEQARLNAETSRMQAQVKNKEVELDAAYDQQKLQIDSQVKAAELRLEQLQLAIKQAEVELKAKELGLKDFKVQADVDAMANKEAREDAKAQNEIAINTMQATKPEENTNGMV